MFNRKPFELPKANYGLKGRARRYRCVLSQDTGNPPTSCARKQIAADSVDAGGRGHDISFTVDPRSRARYERAAKHRSVTAHSDSDVVHWLTNDTRDERFIDNIFAELCVRLQRRRTG